MNALLLAISALLPAVVLCVYVYSKDRVEKEPVGLLLMLLLFGAISCFPAAEIESLLGMILDSFFKNIQVTKTAYYIYNFIYYFVCIALVEETVKFFVLKWKTSKHREFNHTFDGLIYSIFVSLGFAALENILYVFQFGFQTALLRAVLSVPGHMFFAVMMGYHYSKWHIYKAASMIEDELKKSGKIPPNSTNFAYKKSAFFALLMPTIAHGIFDFTCTIGTLPFMLIFLAFEVVMYITCFRKIHLMSRMDCDLGLTAVALVQNKYSHLFDEEKNEESVILKNE